jgi:hypothetical protein
MALTTLPDGTLVDKATWDRFIMGLTNPGQLAELDRYLATLPASVTPQPSAGETAEWGNQRRQLGTNYQDALAQIDFERGNLAARQGVDTQDLTRKFDQMRDRLPGQYQKRGLMNSGIYGGALQDYGTDRAGAFAKMKSQYGEQLGQLDLSKKRTHSQYQSGMTSIDTTEAARRQDLATMIRGI